MPKYPSKKGLTSDEFRKAVNLYNAEWRKTPRAKALQEIKKPKKAELSFKAHLKRHYNMTLGQYEEMLVKQDNRCAICGTHKDNLKRILQVDHDHITGEVRELLCNSCNGGLGLFRDNPTLLRLAEQYINKHRPKQ